MRCYLMLTLLTILAPLTINASANDATKKSNNELLLDEQRDAEARRQQELKSRLDALQQQESTIRNISDKQADYIEKLKAQIDALQAEGAENQ